METKPLLYGLIGFFIGGFIVSVAATTFDKPCDHKQLSGEVAAAQVEEINQMRQWQMDWGYSGLPGYSEAAH